MIELRSDYSAPKDKVSCVCRKCGYEWTVVSNNLLNGCVVCPKCDSVDMVGLREKRRQMYFTKMKILQPDIEVTGDYRNQKSVMHFRNKICGHEWDTISSSPLINSACPVCRRIERGKEQRLSHDEFAQRLFQKSPNIILKSQYTKATDYIDCECAICGNRWSARGYNLHTGNGCPKCADAKVGEKCRATQRHFEDRVAAVLPHVVAIGNYINSKTPVKMKCSVCGNVFHGTPANLYKGEGCPYCNMPHGEVRIAKWLNENNVEFTPGKRFSGLVGLGGGNLSFDFYLHNYNALIEYQGVQHAEPIDIFGGENQLSIQIEHDCRKREYAKMHNIPLLEIWYYEIDCIPDLLLSFISNINIPVSTTVM